MSWGRSWFLWNLTSSDYQQRLRGMRMAAIKNNRDAVQDEQILALRQENHELKLYVAGLLQMLVNRGALSARDIEELVLLVERAEQDARGPERSSSDLEALAEAARNAGK